VAFMPVPHVGAFTTSRIPGHSQSMPSPSNAWQSLSWRDSPTHVRASTDSMVGTGALSAFWGDRLAAFRDGADQWYGLPNVSPALSVLGPLRQERQLAPRSGPSRPLVLAQCLSAEGPGEVWLSAAAPAERWDQLGATWFLDGFRECRRRGRVWTTLPEASLTAATMQGPPNVTGPGGSERILRHGPEQRCRTVRYRQSAGLCHPETANCSAGDARHSASNKARRGEDTPWQPTSCSAL
jgi:hypothetical protein